MRKILAIAVIAALPTFGAAVATGVTPAHASALTCTASGGPPASCSVDQMEKITLNGGSLSLTVANDTNNFTPVDLDGTDKSSSAGIGTITVDDATGSGKGWTVTASTAGQTLTGGPGGAHTLGTLQYNGLSTNGFGGYQVACAPSTSCSAAPSGGTTGTVQLNGGPPSPSVTVSHAASGEGMGTFNITGTGLDVAVPADAYAGDYSVTLTISLVSGP